MNVELKFEIEDIFLDTEPLNNKPFSPIIEIALVSGSGEILFNEIIKPDGNQILADYKVDVLGFDQGDLDRARPLEYYRPVLTALSRNKNICAWGKSDIDKLSFLKLNSNYSDCCQRFSHRYGYFDKYHGNNTWVKLQDACSQIGYVPKGKHRALPDAEACRQVWYHLDTVKAPIPVPFKNINNSNLISLPRFKSNLFTAEVVQNENTF